MKKDKYLPVCSWCGHVETPYHKRWHNNGYKLISAPVFWVCRNKECAYYIEIEDGVIKQNFATPFEWVAPFL